MSSDTVISSVLNLVLEQHEVLVLGFYSKLTPRLKSNQLQMFLMTQSNSNDTFSCYG